VLTNRQRRKLARAYAKLIAHDIEYGADEYVNEAARLIREVIGKRAATEAEDDLDDEYAASGMERDDDD
jgi:hypothetical protein